MIICQGDTLDLPDLPPALQRAAAWPPFGAGQEPGLPELERELIFRTLEKVGGQRLHAAEILGISLEELNLKIQAYRLED